MAEDEAEPEGQSDDTVPAAEPPESRRGHAPRRRVDTEQAIGLEVARLFGISPRLLVTPRAKPSECDEPTESG
jgi:hypothetical protein